MAAGRPTTWTKEIQDKAWEYANGGWETQGDAVPMVVGLCSYIGRSQTSIYKWAKDEDKQFADIVKDIGEKQQQELFNHSLRGDYNASMAKLMLTKHGYSDKVDSDVTSGGKHVKNEWHIHPVTTNGES